jgi:hypothetical protein
MNTEDKIDEIVNVLLEEQYNLSDGYQYYVNNSPDANDCLDVKGYLRYIARKMLERIEKKQS